MQPDSEPPEFINEIISANTYIAENDDGTYTIYINRIPITNEAESQTIHDFLDRDIKIKSEK